MPSRSPRGIAWLPAGLVAAIVGVATGLSLWLFLPEVREGRELALGLAAQAALGSRAVQPGRGAAPLPSAAEQLCRAATAVPLARADCRTGRVLPTEDGGGSPRQVLPVPADALAQAQSRLAQKGRDYATVRDALVSALQGSDRNWLIGGLELRLARLVSLSGSSAVSYPELFDAVLLAEGLRYDSSSGEFFELRWDIARLLDAPGQVAARAERLVFVLQWLPFAAGLAASVAVFFCLFLLGWSAGLISTAFGILIGIGLLVVADASLRYGQGSPFYLLNPFSYALERQAIVVAVVLLLPVGGLAFVSLWGGRLTPLLLTMRRRPAGLVVITMVATSALYSLLGPAAGSEALKLSACLFAGLVTAGYARQTYLAKKVLPDLFSVRSLILGVGEFFSAGPMLSARGLVLASLSRAYLGLLILGLGTMAAAALVFSDFGGTLVSAVVFIALIFILFGLRLALGFILAGGLAAGLALLTEKVQGRVQLMLDPMSASVSDFARLIKFSEAAQPAGYGLGSVRWCSFEGACLPIQALSDYFPTLLSGALGVTGAVVIFLLLVALYTGLMARAVHGLASELGPVSVVYAFSFFLLLAALAQTVITYFGNWRLAPLTGLGLPLMSMGWSSFISAVLGLSLLAMAVRMTPAAGPNGRS